MDQTSLKCFEQQSARYIQNIDTTDIDIRKTKIYNKSHDVVDGRKKIFLLQFVLKEILNKLKSN